MVNFIESIGYSLGKLHTGMICYMCDLWNEGCKEPLDSFFKTWGISLPQDIRLEPRREWESIDLVIFDISSQPYKAFVVIEMKVDDKEHETSKKLGGEVKRGMQTDIYPQIGELQECSHFLFITLGAGEYNKHKQPSGNKFHWIRIRDFHKALESIKSENQLLSDWRKAIKNEISLQDQAYQNNRSLICKYRTGTWNIYVLGNLMNDLLNDMPELDDLIEPETYMYGTRPDTILHFKSKQGKIIYDKLYTEINNNGMLNIKIWLEDDRGIEEKKRKCDEGLEQLKQIGIVPDKIRGGYGKSKTLHSLRIGLIDDDGYLAVKDLKETIFALGKALKMIYKR